MQDAKEAFLILLYPFLKVTVDFKPALFMKYDTKYATWLRDHHTLNLVLDWNIPHISKWDLLISVNQRMLPDTVDFPEEMWSAENEFSMYISMKEEFFSSNHADKKEINKQKRLNLKKKLKKHQKKTKQNTNNN